MFKWSTSTQVESNLNESFYGEVPVWTYIPAPRIAREPDDYELETPVGPLIPDILSKEEVRRILIAWVKRKLFYKSKAARKMQITEIKPSMIFYYVLDTFIEQRALHFSYRKTPLIGTALPANKKMKAWEVECLPEVFFEDATKYFHMPNSDRKGLCISCYGRGLVLCSKCWGSGEISCRKFQASGTVNKVSLCPECTGNKTAPCEKCSAVGHTQCQRCGGKGKIWYFTNLKVEYVTHHKQKVIANEEFPVSMAEKTPGKVVHSHTSKILRPISMCPVEEVNQVSQVMVEESHFAWPDSRIIQQKHSLKAIPINEVHFAWEGLTGHFWVYGSRRQIYFKDYPLRRTCWPLF
ncbi:protein SSUH2 homolog [Heptranchias perlo]|uniref:protein SSUH2 homolog n=1 Tax=Heptranchias perlo TaxID=212740 RepID=UPI00355A0469